ncbi:hypothetical protein GCM10010492_46410 [Saccharothrix mutabilis subsp. mutabilis]|uniref:Putative restriction endonuclease domain-containing protein n=1 Tax=Saccharothrix mutabilis subsp. mutabilis TaxID=66855 RepID=A0ABN0U8A7_9PSEU
MTAMPEDENSRPYTVDDLQGMFDDGRRYELIDGTLLVSPAPGLRHQKIVGILTAVLVPVCPDGMHVLPAPFAVRPSRSTELQPDVLVGRDEDFTDKLLTVRIVAAELLGSLK